ncbi:MAG: hypothetical protein EOO16_18400 [Chitinophagaceae bacterium]|nr:MAG: hypothetical protein EOO16_18400 [Chitinophagaceae bacterium]
MSLPKLPVTGQGFEVAFPDPGPHLASADLEAAWKQFSAEAQFRARLRRLHAAALPAHEVAATLKRTLMPGCRDTHCADAAKLLLWLCGQPPARIHYPKIAQLLGLSYSGVGKLIMSAKKHGLIRRKAYQVYEITEKVTMLLEGLVVDRTPMEPSASPKMHHDTLLKKLH